MRYSYSNDTDSPSRAKDSVLLYGRHKLSEWFIKIKNVFLSGMLPEINQDILEKGFSFGRKLF